MKQCKIIFLAFLLLSCVNQNNKMISEENINYYSNRIVIFWCPTEKEYNECTSKMSEDDYLVFEDDLTYYNTMAISYILEKERGYVNDTNFFIGFIIGKDTVILNKKDVETPMFEPLWKIILFDGKKQPIILAPIDIVEEGKDVLDFFNNGANNE